MAVEIVVQLKPEVASVLSRGAAPTADSEQLSRLVAGVGGALEAMHPGSEDPSLLPWFRVEAQNSAEAERTLDALQRSPVVEAAYIKPPGSPP